MKKMILGLMSLIALAVSAEVMVITLKSGEPIQIDLDEIEEIVFDENEEPEPPTPPTPEEPSVLFPDPILLAEVMKADADADGKLSEDELKSIEEINLGNSEVASLEGIKLLTGLKRLNVQGCTALTAIDLTGLEALVYLQTGNASNLATITLGSKPALTEAYLQYSGLEAIDFSGCPELLKTSVAGTKVTSVDMTACTKLEVFTAGSSVLEEVKLEGCTGLKTISLTSVSKMNGFDISGFPALESFTLSDSQVTTFTTENNPNLKSLTLDSSNNLWKVDVHKSMQLNSLSCLFCYELQEVIMTEGQKDKISSLWGVYDYQIQYVPREFPADVAEVLTNEAFRTVMLAAADTDNDGKISGDEAQAVTEVDAAGKELTEVDFEWFPNITKLNLADNNLTAINLGYVSNLEELYVQNNALTAINFGSNKALRIVNAKNNQIAGALSFPGYNLEEVDMSNNKLTEAKVNFQSKAKKIDLSNNEIAEADIRENGELTDLNISNNKIPSLRFWSMKKLVNVNFSNNPLTDSDQDFKNLPELENVNIDKTEIDILNLSGSNKLKSINASDCPKLTKIIVGSSAGVTITTGAGVEVESLAPPTPFTDPVLLAEVMKGDADGDGILSDDEMKAIEEIILSNSEVASLEGIEHLTGLKRLNVQACTALTSIDLTGLEALEYLQAGNSTNLTTVTLGNKPALKEVYLQYTGLEAIDFSGCPELTTVSVAGTKLTSLDLNASTKLEKLTAGNAALAELKIEACTGLKTLSVSNAGNFSTFDIGGFPALESFSMSDSKISSFATTNNPNLKSLSLDYSNNLWKVDVSKSLQLNSLSCMMCYSLESVIMTEGQKDNITSLWGVSDWMITYVAREFPEDVAAVLSNEAFRAAMIEVADTDNDGKISGDEAKAVTEVSAANKNLTEVDFEWFPNITKLNLSDNSLTAINLAQVAKLEELLIENNSLTSVDFASNKALRIVDASGNQIGGKLSFTGYNLEEVDMSNNKLTEAVVYFQSKVKKIDLSNNEIAEADIRSNDILTDLDISNNKIASLRFWSMKKLVNVNFSNNPLVDSDQDFKNLPELENVDVRNTQLDVLNMQGSSKLKTVQATGCPNLTKIIVGSAEGVEITKDDNVVVEVYTAE